MLLHDYKNYTGKPHTNSNLAWHRPQSEHSRHEDELKEKCERKMSLSCPTDPLEKLRLLCFARGAAGILELGRVFRKMDVDDRKERQYEGEYFQGHKRLNKDDSVYGCRQLNKEEFFNRIKGTGLDFSDAEIDELFNKFDPDHKGLLDVEEFITHLRPPMSETRLLILKKAFNKLDKSDTGIVDIEDFRREFSCDSNTRYKSGEDSGAHILSRFLSNFETEGLVNGKVTFEEFMNYYSGVSMSIDSDCYFDLVIRQEYKL